VTTEPPDDQLDLLAELPRAEPPADADGLVTRESWGRFDRQQPVAVQGLRGEFVFWAHSTNVATGDTWITVYGGRKGGVRQFRSVEAERVTPRRTPVRRAPRPVPPEQPTLDLS
jgi:hypothetical protein